MIDDTPEKHHQFDAQGRWSSCSPVCKECERVRGYVRRDMQSEIDARDAQIAALRSALEESDGCITHWTGCCGNEELASGCNCGQAEIQRRIDEALDSTAQASAAFMERCREEGRCEGIEQDWETCWKAYVEEDLSKLTTDAQALRKAMQQISERIRADERTMVADHLTSNDTTWDTMAELVEVISALGPKPDGGGA